MSERILGKGSQPVKGSSEAEEKLRAEPSELVAAVTREMSEPTDGLAPTPVGLVLFFFLLAGWAGYYLSSNSGGFNANTYDEHYARRREPSGSSRHRRIPWCWAAGPSTCVHSAIRRTASVWRELIRPCPARRLFWAILRRLLVFCSTACMAILRLPGRFTTERCRRGIA